MKKKDLKAIFGGTYVTVAKALGITKGALPQWRETLTLAQIDRARGAAVRLGVYKPELFGDTVNNSKINAINPKKTTDKQEKS